MSISNAEKTEDHYHTGALGLMFLRGVNDNMITLGSGACKLLKINFSLPFSCKVISKMASEQVRGEDV